MFFFSIWLCIKYTYYWRVSNTFDRHLTRRKYEVAVSDNMGGPDLCLPPVNWPQRFDATKLPTHTFTNHTLITFFTSLCHCFPRFISIRKVLTSSWLVHCRNLHIENNHFINLTKSKAPKLFRLSLGERREV